MVNAFARSFFCASNSCFASRLFDNLSTLLEYPDLHQAEKLLWIWLANQCAKKSSRACNYSYHQLSLVMNQPCKQIHHALFRLLTMGFLRADLPIWYGKLTPEMCHQIHLLNIVAPTKDFMEKRKALQADLTYRINLANLTQQKLININLLKEENDND